MTAIKTVPLPESNLYAENFDRADKAIKNGWDVVVEDDYATYTCTPSELSQIVEDLAPGEGFSVMVYLIPIGADAQ